MANIAKAKHGTLTAATVASWTFTTNFAFVEVKNRAASSTAGISFTTDGSTPTVLGDDTELVLPGESIIVPLDNSDTVKLISATADAYSVTGVVG